MADRPRIFDDLAGLAGGALSAVSGLRDEIEAMVRARIDEALRRLELVRREEMEVAMELAVAARQEAATATAALATLEARLAALEARSEPRGERRTRPAAEPGS